MIEERITNPAKIDAAQVASWIGSGAGVTIQFTGSKYPPQVLKMVETLCQEHGERLTVRFYSVREFDASVLEQIPSVRSLCVHDFDSIKNLSVITKLRHLKTFWTGGGFKEFDFLKSDNLKALTRLTLGPTPKPGFDLSALSGMEALKFLNLCGHTRNLAAIGGLAKLETLRLTSLPPICQLGFVNHLSRLKELTIILGGRENIDEIGHPGLVELEIVRVRGFGRLDPTRFPKLKKLQIEDQIRLRSLSFPKQNKDLFRLAVLNCKGLVELEGLKNLRCLEDLRISRTSLVFDRLLDHGFPPHLKTGYFGTGRAKEDKAILKRLKELGYEFV